MISLADDCSIIIKRSDKGFCVEVWGRNVWVRNEYIVEVEKQVGHKNICKGVNFGDRILVDL